MSFHIEVLPDAPIMIHSHEPGPGQSEDIPDSMSDLAALLSCQPRPVYLVLNLRGASMGPDDFMKTPGDPAHGPGVVLYHPNVIETLFVVPDRLLKMGAMGPISQAFGGAKLRTFDTLEQALGYCRVRMFESAKH